MMRMRDMILHLGDIWNESGSLAALSCGALKRPRFAAKLQMKKNTEQEQTREGEE